MFAFTTTNTGCTKSETEEPGKEEPAGPDTPPQEDEIDWKKIDPKATVRGVVRCEGKGVQGVVVTDGVNMHKNLPLPLTTKMSRHCNRSPPYPSKTSDTQLPRIP